MSDFLSWPVVSGLIRHVLTTAGGVLAANGWIAESDVNTAVGAIVALVGVAWSVAAKRAQ